MLTKVDLLSIRNVVSKQVKEELQPVKDDLKGIKSDIKVLKHDYAKVRSDINMIGCSKFLCS